MNKKITALCSLLVALSVCIATVGATNANKENNVTTAVINNHYAQRTEETTADALGGLSDMLGGLGGDSLGGVGDALGDIGSGSSGGLGDSLGGIGDAFGGIGDALGGITGGLGDSLGGVLGGLGGGTTVVTTAPSTTSADIGLIIPVPAATQAPTETQAPATSAESTEVGETVDFAADSNPYTKPTATFVAGDEDETIKWLQWIFIYTGYGLEDNGITGVLDEDTVGVVKKLQHENKMNVDGNITEEVIKAAEVLYYQSILGGDVSAIEISSEATTGEGTSDTEVNNGNESTVPVVLLVIILVIVWVLAIGGIILLFVYKKKKINAVNNSAQSNGDAQPAKENKADGSEIKSLSDLFEKADNNDK